MKTKLRFMFVGAAMFVIIVSYKILEPELFRSEEMSFAGGKEPFESDNEGQQTPAIDHHRNRFYVEDGSINQPAKLGVHDATGTQNSSTIEVVELIIISY